MYGNNKLMLNEATLIDAVQEYLDRRFAPTYKDRPTVTGVTELSTTGGREFRVSLSGGGDRQNGQGQQ